MTQGFVRAGVIGFPVDHSLSPLIHNYWIGKYGLPGRYEAIEVPPGQLPDKLRDFIGRGYSGFNVTLPHKQEVMALCDEMDEAAQAIGAVNTLAVRDGRIYGWNTDAPGFTAGIREAAPGFDFTAGPALVLGAGGAARAIVHALKREGAPEIRIVNRTESRAEEMADVFGVTAGSWENRSALGRNVSLLVNTTALGMKGQPPLAFDVSSLPPQALVCDIVYNPLQTDLLRAAAARGNPVAGGLGMLLQQARPGFEAWFGIAPEITPDLRRLLAEALP